MSDSPTDLPRVEVRAAFWPQDEAGIRRIREEVFVKEQRVPLALEWDGRDPDCLHVLAVAGNELVGTGRMTTDGHIGRMAVRKPWRGRGAGSALLRALLDMALQGGLEEVHLNAQTTAVPFYLRHGFQPDGDVFMEAGIPHRHMRRAVKGGGV